MSGGISAGDIAKGTTASGVSTATSGAPRWVAIRTGRATSKRVISLTWRKGCAGCTTCVCGRPATRLTRVCIWCFPLRDDRFLRVRRRARMWLRKQQCPCQPVCLLMRTHFVIATPYLIRGWQSRRRSNGGSSTCVQPHRDCHVVRQAHHERLCSSQ